MVSGASRLDSCVLSNVLCMATSVAGVLGESNICTDVFGPFIFYRFAYRGSESDRGTSFLIFMRDKTKNAVFSNPHVNLPPVDQVEVVVTQPSLDCMPQMWRTRYKHRDRGDPSNRFLLFFVEIYPKLSAFCFQLFSSSSFPAVAETQKQQKEARVFDQNRFYFLEEEEKSFLLLLCPKWALWSVEMCWWPKEPSSGSFWSFCAVPGRNFSSAAAALKLLKKERRGHEKIKRETKFPPPPSANFPQNRCGEKLI